MLRGLEAVGLLFLDGSGRVLDADVRAREILGVHLERVLGRALPAVLQSDSIADALRHSARSGENVPLDIPFSRPVDECVAVAVHPAPNGFTVPIRNRQDQRQHTIGRRLRERIVASIPVGLAILDAAERVLPVRYINDAFKAQTGHDVESLGSAGIRALAHDVVELELALERAAGGERVAFEARLRRADGTAFWGALVLSPVGDEQDVTSFILLVLEDVTERVEARTSLAESERRYRLLAERSSDIVARQDPAGNTLYISPATRRILGYDPVSYLAHNPWQLVHPEDRQRLQEDLAAVARGEPPAPMALFRTRHAEGHYVWLEMNVTVVRDNGGQVTEFVTVSRDVSVRVAAQHELQRSQESFRRLFADNPVPMWVHDAHTLEVLEVNAGAVDLLGYERDELLHAATTTFVREAERDAYLSAVEAMTEGRGSFGEVAIRRKDGEPLVVALEKSPLMFDKREARLVAAQDVTEARRAQQALEASELRFRRLVERSNDVIAISDNRGSLTYVSEGVEAITGWAPDELVGTSLADFIHPDDLAAAERFRVEVAANGTAKMPLYRFRHRDGSWRWFTATGRDLRDEPAVRGVVVNTHDVTERVADLQEIESTREATFRALGLALEYRDLETKGHTDRVAAMSQRFADALGFDEDQRQAITWGAYLHDLGKIAMPDAILLKPGRLTEEEFAVIRRHTLIGEDMCRDVPFLPAATRQLIRSHHERWDGRGYPDGLAGESAPLKARMFSVVDVYDALTSQRPYKHAWRREDAEAELRRQAGTQFDPHLVAVFLERVLT